ncbi:MAG: radical SAM protein [Acidobacteria bacterium]|nr:radical SAM protein [Acidobacteriota bacterium]
MKAPEDQAAGGGARIRHAVSRSILSPVSGFLAQAGFSHSLTPARNCTYGCLYCYVPTMRIQGGLKPEDWRHWGAHTTFKSNAALLLARALRPGQRIYCSPLTDPYQPAEAEQRAMPAILAALLDSPPQVFTLQTRSPLVLRDLELLQRLNERTALRVSFSITTDRDDVRRRYEPHCEPIPERLDAIRALRRTGLRVHATLAPLLPCDPEKLASLALEASGEDLVGDPLHVRAAKPAGATTREAALRLAARFGEQDWFDPPFQQRAIERICAAAERAGRRFVVGPSGFGLLATPD